MTTYRLTQYRLCPKSRGIRLAMGELGLEAELFEEQPWQYRPHFLGKNPAGELPVLELSNALTLCGAYAISEYLSENAASSPQSGRRTESLFPGNVEERAEVRRLVDWFNGKLDREVTRELLIEKVYQRLHPTNPQSPDADILRAARVNLRYHLSYVSYLSETRRWLAGDQMSFADLSAAAHISVIDFLGEVPWSEYPASKLWYARMKSRPAFRPLLADRVPGVVPPASYADLDF
ncbi:MAG: glutathione S-transferase family protein [Hyphomicrobiaceae bacterium]